MNLFFRKELGGFRPDNAAAEEAFRKIRLGDTVSVEIKKPRNIRHHRKWWKLMEVVAENMDQQITPETLCEVIKVSIGHCSVIKTKAGIVQIPKSISFAQMNQTAFDDFYNRALNFIVQDVLPGVGKDALTNEVENFL